MPHRASVSPAIGRGQQEVLGFTLLMGCSPSPQPAFPPHGIPVMAAGGRAGASQCCCGCLGLLGVLGGFPAVRQQNHGRRGRISAGSAPRLLAEAGSSVLPGLAFPLPAEREKHQVNKAWVGAPAATGAPHSIPEPWEGADLGSVGSRDPRGCRMQQDRIWGCRDQWRGRIWG